MYAFSYRKLFIFLASTLLIIFAGCGYQFSVQGPGPVIGGSVGAIKDPEAIRLTIREFINRSFSTNLEAIYTNYMRQEFALSAGATVLHEEDRADFLMKGEILSVTLPALTFSTTQTRESRVKVLVRITVENRKSGKIVWNSTATGIGEFFVNQSSDTEGSQDQLQFNQVLQDRALEQAGQQIAEALAANFLDARDRGSFKISPTQAKPALGQG